MSDHGLTPKHLAIIRATIMPFAASIERVGIFGSRATGVAKPNSDLDIVLYGRVNQETVNRIYTLFTVSYLPFTVDVQAYDLVKYPPLKQHIDDHMQLLFSREDLLKETNATT